MLTVRTSINIIEESKMMKKFISALFLLIVFCSCEDVYQDEEGVTYIYEGRYSSTVAYRIEDNYIYEGRFSPTVKYRIENNYIYEGRFYPAILYRIEKK